MSDKQAISEAELQAWVDGRLDEGRRAELEAWYAAHPDEAERAATYRSFNELLRVHYDPVLEEPVPPRLERAARRGSRLRSIALVAGWVTLGIAVGSIAGWQLHALQTLPQANRAEAPVIARRAALAHATYSPEVRHPVEVGADQEQHLVAWLSKRLGGEVRAPKLDGEGMALVGGRLLPGDPGPVAQFMYQNAQGRRVTLYVRTEALEQRETAFRFTREGNVRVFYWIDRKFGYALSSADMERDELLKLANLVYRQLNP